MIKVFLPTTSIQVLGRRQTGKQVNYNNLKSTQVGLEIIKSSDTDIKPPHSAVSRVSGPLVKCRTVTEVCDTVGEGLSATLNAFSILIL